MNRGDYKVGKIEDGRRRGEYGVIRGKRANKNGHEEWKGFIGLHESKWFAYRIYDSGSGFSSVCPTTELLDVFDSKSDAVKWLKRKYNFDEKF